MLILDRYEEEYAILEYNHETFSLPAILLLDLDAKEGDVISLSIAERLTSEKKKEAAEKLQSLFDKTKKEQA